MTYLNDGRAGAGVLGPHGCLDTTASSPRRLIGHGYKYAGGWRTANEAQIHTNSKI